ncbi:MAG: hypothetical protein K0U54_07740 [Bacteroidetes bacterium]|nr:hypothetical protein [Bacteroidota bacterium]
MNTVIKNNRLMRSSRKKLHELDLDYSSGSYKKFDDHRTMNVHEFATFQKEQFRKRKEEKRKQRYLMLVVSIIVIILVICFLTFWEYYDFDLLTSSQFQ